MVEEKLLTVRDVSSILGISEKEVLDWFREARFENLTLLRPEKVGRLYGWFYHHNLIIGSGVNVLGQKRA